MRIVILLLIAAAAWGQTVVTITGPLKMADASGFTGDMIVSWPAMLCGTTPVRKGSQAFKIVAGVVPTIQLYPTASCGNNRYTVSYTGGTQSYWTIPATPSTQSIASIETLTAPALPVIPPFAIGQVSGLRAELDALALLIPGGTVPSVFGRTGAVVAVSGDYTTSLVTEGTRLYYTDARVRAAITASSPLVFNGSTGELTCPTCNTGDNTTVGLGLSLTGAEVSVDETTTPQYSTSSAAFTGACTVGHLGFRDGGTLYVCDPNALTWAAISAGAYTLPAPGVATLGGVFRNTGSAGEFVNGVDTDGSLLYATPATGDTLPTQTGNGGKYLKTDGSATSWDTPSGSSGFTAIKPSYPLSDSLSSAGYFATELTIPSGTLAVGSMIELYVQGVHTIAASSRTLMYRIYFCSVSGCGSGTTITITPLGNASGATNVTAGTWALRANVLVTAIGASGSIIGTGVENVWTSGSAAASIGMEGAGTIATNANIYIRANLVTTLGAGDSANLNTITARIY